MNHFHYYHILPFLQKQSDIVTFCLINHKTNHAVNSAPYYVYSSPHQTLLFKSLTSVEVTFPASCYFLQKLINECKLLVAVSLKITEVNKSIFYSTETPEKPFLLTLLKCLQQKQLSFNVSFDASAFLKGTSSNVSKLALIFTPFEMSTFNTSIREMDITLQQFTPISVLDSFLNHHFLKKVVIRIDYQCQWEFVRSVCNIINTDTTKGVIYLNNQVILESDDIDELMVGIPMNICIVTNNGYIACNGKCFRYGQFEKDNIIQQNGSQSVEIIEPLPQVILDETIFRTEKGIVDISNEHWIQEVRTKYDLNNIKFNQEVTSLIFSGVPSTLQTSIKELELSDVNTTLVDLVSSAFSKFSLHNSNIDQLLLPTTITSLSFQYVTIPKVSMNYSLKKCWISSCNLPSLLLPTTTTSLSVFSTNVPFIHLSNLVELQLEMIDHSKLSSIPRFSKLTSLTFVAINVPKITDTTELHSLSFGTSLKYCSLYHVCFSKLTALNLQQLHIDYIQPIYTINDNITIPTTISPILTLPTLNKLKVSGVEKFLKTIKSREIHLTNCKEITLGNVYSLHLKNCSGNVNFEKEEDMQKLQFLHLYNCNFSISTLQLFTSIRKLRIDIFKKFNQTHWPLLSFLHLKELSLSCPSIRYDSLQIPTTVTSLCITSYKKTGTLSQTILSQLSVLSLN